MDKTKIPYKAIEDYLRTNTDHEMCGLIIVRKGKLRFVPTDNSHPDPTKYFTISKQEFARAGANGEVVCVVHSHIRAPYHPSEADSAAQRVSALPWLVVGLNGPETVFNWLEQEYKKLPLFGRTYQWYISDCFTFVRDWYFEEYGIIIEDVPYVENFWEHEGEPYLENLEKAGFVEVPLQEIKFGDGILMRLADGYETTTHAAIYLGGNTIAHHLPNRLSSTDMYNKRYIDRTTKIVRHKDNF